jgi:hypothetical protein
MDLIIFSLALALFIEMEVYYFLANFWRVQE